MNSPYSEQQDLKKHVKPCIVIDNTKWSSASIICNQRHILRDAGYELMTLITISDSYLHFPMTPMA